MNISGYLFGLTNENRDQVFNSIAHLLSEHRYQLQHYQESDSRLDFIVEDLNPARRESILELSNYPDEPEELIAFLRSEPKSTAPLSNPSYPQ